MAHRIWIRSYHREGEWVDGYWRKIDDVAKAVKKLNTTDRAAVQLPDGVEISRAAQHEGGGYFVTGGQESGPEHVNTYNAHEAARTALQRSARSTHPRSLGGGRSFQTHVQAAKADRAKARREAGGTTKPRRSSDAFRRGTSVEFDDGAVVRQGKVTRVSGKTVYVNTGSDTNPKIHVLDRGQVRLLKEPTPTSKYGNEVRIKTTKVGKTHEPDDGRGFARDRYHGSVVATDEKGNGLASAFLEDEGIWWHAESERGTSAAFETQEQAREWVEEEAYLALEHLKRREATTEPTPKPTPTPPRGKPTPDPEPPPTPPGGTSQDDLAKAKRKFRKLRRETTKLEDTLNRHALTAGQQATLEKKLTLKRSQLETQERLVKNLEETGGKPEPRNEPGGRKRATPPEPKASTSSFTMFKADADALLSQVDRRGFRPDDDQAKHWDSVKSKLQLASGRPGDKIKLKLTDAENRALADMAEHVEGFFRDAVNKDPRADNVNSHIRNMMGLSDVKKRARRKVPLEGGGKLDALVRTDFKPDKQSTVREQLNQLLNVHSLPTGVHRIDIGRLDPREYPRFNGVYLGGFSGTGRIQLRENAGPLTLWHEVGHYLDYQKMKQQFSYKPASESARGEAIAKQMKNLMSTIEETAGIQRIRRQASGSTGRMRPSKHQRYLLQKREQFARAYAQYIATKTQNAHALQEIERRSHSLYSADQWKRDDFQPVVEAFDKLMKELGWIQ